MNIRKNFELRGVVLLACVAIPLTGPMSCLQTIPDDGPPDHVPADLELTLFYDSSVASFTHPIGFEELPGEAGTFAIASLSGDIQLLHVDSAGETTVRPFAQVPVSLAPYTDGLLGLTFHPGFAVNRKYYVYYTATRGEVRLTERMAKPDIAEDAGVERELFSLPVAAFGHYGGDLRFGPDGYLYLGIGDGARAGEFLQAQDSLNADAQSLSVLYGKMIRIDVNGRDSGLGYAIPTDNPFVGSTDSGVRGEIWAYGMRQPWRGSFDPVSGRYLVGDVGLVHSEEIDLIVKGGNYGWRRTEGADNCFNDTAFLYPLPSCDTDGIIPPVIEIKRDPPYPPKSILGGYVFRGDPNSPHYGAYIFGESSEGAIYFVPATALNEPNGERYVIAHASPNMGGFGTDSKGNLYTIEYEAGIIRRLDHPDLSGKLEPTP